jgi:hypothetical protein
VSDVISNKSLIDTVGQDSVPAHKN